MGESVGESADAARVIAASTHQQNAAMDQIAHAMNESRQATTQFVAGAQETQTAVGGLSELARELQRLTEGNGAGARTGAAPAPRASRR